MSYRGGTLLAVDSQIGVSQDPRSAVSERWRLNRAGIVNVYQYENEVLHFAGGRLLLRGVNGSGKSTAMNMLLPFLLTTSEGRIDAAGEQSGILKSWMLNGRDDPQPVGYLWIEFERLGEFLVCGCGIKANRQSERVTTWWFITSKRPEIDFQLVSGGVALSTEVLRAALEGDEVFVERRRRDYRHAVEQRLFGGASIEAHIGLLNKVRSPRVGDRIDLDLREHLVESLPALSEQALAEAAEPLENLDEHRRSVAELAKTLEAVRGLLDVYRSYCLCDLSQRTEAASGSLGALDDCVRDEKRKARAVDAAGAQLNKLNEEMEESTRSQRRLQLEIEALEKSAAYREGLQLEGLRNHVAELAKQCERSDQRVREIEERVQTDREGLVQAANRGRNDRQRLNDALADVLKMSRNCGLDRKPPGPVLVGEVGTDGDDASQPGTFDSKPVEREINAVVASVRRRRDDVDQVENALTSEREGERRIRQAELTHEHSVGAVERASKRLTENNRRLAAARKAWAGQVRRWALQVSDLFQTAGIEPLARTVSLSVAAGSGHDDLTGGDNAFHDGGVVHDDLDSLRVSLLSEADMLVEHWQSVLAGVESRLVGEQDAEREALAAVEELARRTEPDPPRFGWQSDAEYCLADLIDFAEHLDDGQRAGLEAGLQASGLLSAKLGDDALMLADGELVAVVNGGVCNPLSEHLVVTVPQRLAGEISEGSMLKLLDSISCDPTAEAVACVSLDGSFKVGPLRGRHSKQRAEHVGATARRAALEQARAEAAQRLELARDALQQSQAEREEYRASLQEARDQRSRLPVTEPIITALSTVAADTETLEEAVAQRDVTEQKVVEAEKYHSDVSDELHRLATTLSLPREDQGLNTIRAELVETDSTLQQCLSRITILGRSVDDWRNAADRLLQTSDSCNTERAELARVKKTYEEKHAILATIEDSIGAEYSEVVATRDRCRAELDEVEQHIPELRDESHEAVSNRAEAVAAHKTAAQIREHAESKCEAVRVSLDQALTTRGYLAAMGVTDAPVAHSAGAQGLRELLGPLASLPTAEAEASSESVRQSLQRRRDSLGAGWDAEALHPDLNQPLIVEVTGPSGRAPLAEQEQAVQQQYRQVDSLLNRKQDDALRQLLQGHIAGEIAEKIHGAKRLVDRTNERLGAVSTAHKVGVELRWRRSGELDTPTQRLVELLAKTPDLRTDDEQNELRGLLSNRLAEARVDHPDLPYQQLIADTLDYKQWHEMAIMVRRGVDVSRLGRTTPLSEGEKKLVTYLPLFSAVAASCDALAKQQAVHNSERGTARFVLLDDAFAKVSEDNHAALFGLLVDLDLDFIATSERLWGDHKTVPELSITEVIRDAGLGAILLEHYRWDGFTLERQGIP